MAVYAALGAALLVIFPLGAPAGASGGPPTYQWPEIHQNGQLNGYNADPALSTSNAATLGVSWMTYTGGAVLSSPVAAWNTTDNETLVYVGNEAGYFTAYNQATGAPVWSDAFSVPIRSTPLVEGAYVWVAPTASLRLYKLNAATGAVVCSAPMPYDVDSSPIVATPPGGQPTVYVGVNDSATFNGPLVAVNEATCGIDFSSTPEPEPATGGIWDPVSYGVSATGEGLVVFGTADPDEAVYAIDAITGAMVWRVQGAGTGDDDFGAGVTISAPGVNGFADGVAYAMDKDGYVYAIDLTTGAVDWVKQTGGGIVTPTLDGKKLIIGAFGNVRAVSALTGQVVWSAAAGPGSPDSSPAIIGPSGSEIVVFGDLTGKVHVLSLSTGASLFTYQTGNYITSSPAEVSGNVLEASADGFLYDFAPGGSTASAPVTAISSPSNSATLANPNGSMSITGSAGASGGPAVGAVDVDIAQGGTGGPWWDGATSSWVASPYPNLATLSSPGSSTTTWSLSVPIPSTGGVFEAYASAVSSGGIADESAFGSGPAAGRVSFTVQAGSGPTLSTGGAFYVPPANAVAASGTGFSPGETVNISLHGQVLAEVTATTSGGFGPTSVIIPVGSSTLNSFGPADLIATGQSSGLVAVAAIYLTNSWSEAGQGPLHQSYEANDDVFADQVNVTASSVYTQAWDYTSSATVEAPPVVLDGVAYFADASGGVTAVSVNNGMTRWHVTVGGGSAIDASPAIANVNGAFTLIVGTASGSLVALNAKNGATVWSTSLGSSAIESAPTIAVASSPGVSLAVYVGNDAGGLFAVNEATGAILWQTTVNGPVHSSPAVDAPAGNVVVGDSSGNVTEFATRTGAQKWVFATGGAVVANPLIYKGGVYVGSDSANFYDLNESSGAVTWSESTGANAVTAGAAVLPSGGSAEIAVGDAGGNVYTFDAGTGASDVIETLSSPVIGVSTLSATIMVETANGTLWVEKQGDSLAGFTCSLGAAGTAGPDPVNGAIYATAANGLHVYTLPESPPV